MANPMEPPDELRRRMIASAISIIASQGRDGLTARRLSNAVGVSTKIIYSHFGGMSAVVRTVYEDAFARLAERMCEAAASERDLPGKYTSAFDAYRAFALESADRFEIMYGTPALTLVPNIDDRIAAAPSLDVIVNIYELTGLPSVAARRAAYRSWARVHGAVALEVGGWLRNGDVFADIVSETTPSGS